MTTHNQLTTALKFAAVKHAGQFRKGTNVPYLVHPVEVAMLLQQYLCPDDVIVAGFLHDTLEDTDATYEEIENIFGTKVVNIILELTEISKKRAYIKAKSYSAEASLVKAADIICNVGNIYEDYQSIGNEVFDRFIHGKATLDHYEKMADLLIIKTAYYSTDIVNNLVNTLTKIKLMS